MTPAIASVPKRLTGVVYCHIADRGIGFVEVDGDDVLVSRDVLDAPLRAGLRIEFTATANALGDNYALTARVIPGGAK